MNSGNDVCKAVDLLSFVTERKYKSMLAQHKQQLQILTFFLHAKQERQDSRFETEFF